MKDESTGEMAVEARMTTIVALGGVLVAAIRL